MTTLVEKYIANPNVCPHCGSYELLADPMNMAPPRAMTQKVWCNGCGEDWLDVYTLTSIKPIEHTEDKSNDDVHGDLSEQQRSTTNTSVQRVVA